LFGITSTRETMHGIVRLDGDKVVLQWRTERKIDRVGWTIGTEREVDPVREVSLPLAVLADAQVRLGWLRRYLVLKGADLRAFEQLASSEALPMTHPAELVLRVPRSGREAALEFASDIRLALADRAIATAETMQIESARRPG